MAKKQGSSNPAGSLNPKDQKLFSEFLKQSTKGNKENTEFLSQAEKLQRQIKKNEKELLYAIEARNKAQTAYNDLSAQIAERQKNMTKEQRKQGSLVDDALDAYKKKEKFELKSLDHQIKAAKNQKKTLEAAKEQLKQLAAAAKKAEELSEKYEEMFEPFEEVDAFVKKLPGGGLISKALGLDTLGEKIKHQLVKQLTEGQMAGKGLIASLGPLLPLLIAVGLAAKAFEFDKEVTQFSKDLDVSKDAAKGLSSEADHLATSMGMAGITGKEMQASMTALRNEFGSMAIATDEGLLKNVTLLRERMGLTNEEAIGLQHTATLLGTDLDSLAAGSMKMAEGLISGKQMLQEMSKIPKGILTSFKGTTKELQKAVVQGKLFGLSLEKTAKIGEGLLDVESSLEAEMKANVLTGRSMNLNRARELALAGDVAGLQDELLHQAGSLEEFNKMGPIGQKAMAEAMGMTKDEMADMLTKAQELKDANLSTAQVDEIMKKNAKERDALMANMDDKQKGYLKKLVEQRNQEEATAKFQASMARMMEALGKVLMPVVDGLGMILGFVGDIIDYLTMGVEFLTGWMHPVDDTKEGLKEGESILGNILKISLGIGAAMLAWKAGKAALGGMKGLMGGGAGGGGGLLGGLMGGGGAESITPDSGKGSKILEGLKGFIEGISSILQTAIKAVADLGSSLVNGVFRIVNAVLDGLGSAAQRLPKIMTALGEAVVAFFTPMAALAAPPIILGIVIFTGAMIGLAYAFKLLGEGIGAAAPGIEAFFNGIGTIIEKVGQAIATVIETITDSVVRLQDIDGAKLLVTAAGIGAVGLALAAFGAGAGVGGIGAALGSLFDEDPVDKFNRFAEINAGKLITVAGAIMALGNALNNFSSAVGSMPDIENVADGLEDIATVAPALATVSTKSSAATTTTAGSGTMSEVTALLKELIAKVDQPMQINVSGKVIDEMERQSSVRRTYNTKIDGAYGANG